MSHSAISVAESAYTTGPIRPWIWKCGDISVINRDRSETSSPMNAGPTSVVKVALVAGQATYPQPSTSGSVQTRTNRESTEVKFIPTNAVAAAPHVERHTPYKASARHSTKRQSSSHQSGIANPVQEPILIIDWAPSTYGQYDFSAGSVGKNLQRCS